MSRKSKRACPECAEIDRVAAEPVDRRGFLKAVGAGAAALTLSRSAFARQDAKPAANVKAEELIKELYTGLTPEQKGMVVGAYESPDRLKFYNNALGKNIGTAYTKPQQELVQRILRSLSSGEEGWKQITRDGTWDNSKAFENCGANLFGDVSGKYTWVFSGHHLTLRCDGSSTDGVALGGPQYYGHTPNGYNEKNVFWYQTKGVLSVFDALNEEQRKKALMKDSPGEGMGSVKFRGDGEAKPGVAYAELGKDVQELVMKVMRDVLSPYRKEDGDEVMQVIKDKGGMEKVHLGFFQEKDASPRQPWAFWRLEGPGFVWNYRVLPHVHTFVNISSKA
jgi:hypothetical protein